MQFEVILFYLFSFSATVISATFTVNAICCNYFVTDEIETQLYTHNWIVQWLMTLPRTQETRVEIPVRTWQDP